jgi:outer membrane immunogenic protein
MRVMNRSVLAAAAALALAGRAFAADAPTRPVARAPAIAALPSVTWTGFYAGAHGSFVWMDHDVSLASVRPGGLLETDIRNRTLATQVSINESALSGGVQAGFNVQFGNFVVGGEADAALFSGSAKETYSAPDLFLFFGAMTHSTFGSEIDALGTVRLRGGVALGRALFFATGGLAVAEVTNSFAVAIPGFYANSWSEDRTAWGWTAGAGVEYAISDRVTGKLDVLHYDLADRTIRYMDPPVFGPEFIDYKFKQRGTLLRTGLAFRF